MADQLAMVHSERCGAMRRWVPVSLLALAAAFFWRLWLMPTGFLYHTNSAYSDLMITHWPSAFFIRHSLATWGQVPLWRSAILSGEPFAANPLSGLWYPPNLLLLALPLAPAFNLLSILHTAWAGWGGYLLARSIGASRAGGMIAAFTLMFSPKAIAHLASGHVGLYGAWAWLPWVILATRRLARRGRPGDVAATAGAIACLILADVRMGFYGGMAAAGYWLWLLVRGWRTSTRVPTVAARGRLLTGIGAGLLTTALVAAQGLPLVAVADRLSRGGLTVAEGGRLSLPPPYLLGLLVANQGGGHEWMTYVGTMGLLLAVVGLFRWRNKERWWWGGVVLTAAVYSLGTYTPVYPLLRRTVSVVGWLRGPGRAWFLVVLSGAMLAAQGLTALEERGAKRLGAHRGASLRTGRARGRRIGRNHRDLLVPGLVAAMMAGAGAGLILRLPSSVVTAAVLWPAAGILVALRNERRLGASRFAALALVLALVDLWRVGFTLYRVRSQQDVLGEGQAAAAWLADSDERRFRVYSPSYSIPQHTGMLHGIEAADGVDPFQMSDYVAFMRLATKVDIPGYSVTVPSFPEVSDREEMLSAHQYVMPNLRLLGLLNVRYVAAAYPIEAPGLVPVGERDGVYLYQNERWLPRALVVERVHEVQDQAEALEWLRENDPAYAAVVEREGTELNEDADLAAAPLRSREARIARWTPNEIQVEAEGPGVLVLSEVYDPDWRVEVDDRETELVRTNGILRGVFLGEGVHQVTFVYRPAGLWAGCAVSGVGWLCAAVLWVYGRAGKFRVGRAVSLDLNRLPEVGGSK